MRSVGPPPSKPHINYGPPKPQYQSSGSLKPFYGPPIKAAVNFKPQQTYGLPPTPLRQPIPQYGPPALQSLPSFQSLPAFQSLPQSLPQQSLPPQSFPSFPKPIKSAGCDGWKPIPSPSFGSQAFAHSSSATIESIQPDNGYLPPPPAENTLHVADATLSVQPLPTNLQLPIAEASNFHNDANLGSNIASGLGLTTFNVVKSEGAEVRSFCGSVLHSQ